MPSAASESNRQIMVSNDVSNFKLYQAWKGSNVFCCGGRLIFGPDARSLILTIILIVTPVVFFCLFVAPKLINEFQGGSFILAACLVFTVYVIVLLFLTSSRDPGIILRNSHPPEDDGSCISADWPGLNSLSSIPPTKEVLVNGMTVRVKYCQTCMLYRPPRCSHCSICNNCVERFDHHCPWVGQCIGKRNYRFFFMFVSSTTMLCLYVFTFCWVNISKMKDMHDCSVWRAALKSPVSGVLILYTFICAWFVGGLTAFHLYLMCTNQTTYENFRYRYDGKTNPYNLGCVRNIIEIFFKKIPKANNFRAVVKVDSSSAFSTGLMPMSHHASSPEMPKTSFDIEVGKRQAVGDEDLEDIRSQLDSVSGSERCVQPPHANWDNKPNWEIQPDLQMSATEVQINNDLSHPTRQKISTAH